MRTYIPLNALRAFEAAARHLSFTRAATELCVTPTAISHQIRSLEEFLETSLFERKNGKLILTPATTNALQELSEGFNKLESALLTLNRRGGRRKITIAASPSVAALWLMPRLQRFFVLAPDVDVSLSTRSRQVIWAMVVLTCRSAAAMIIPGARSNISWTRRSSPSVVRRFWAGAALASR